MTVRLPIVLPSAAGLLALLWTLAAPGAAARAGERLAGPVPAVVTKVVDGDTLEVRFLPEPNPDSPDAPPPPTIEMDHPSDP